MHLADWQRPAEQETLGLLSTDLQDRDRLLGGLDAFCLLVAVSENSTERLLRSV
jgi:hypothetical protein